jgi:hypothetical protein
MYLNVYVPQLQRVGGVVWFLRDHLGQRFAPTATVAPRTEAFVKEIECVARQHRIDVVSFAKGERKDEVTQRYLARRSRRREGVLYVGKAQEKARVVRATAETGAGSVHPGQCPFRGIGAQGTAGMGGAKEAPAGVTTHRGRRHP